MRRVDAIDFCLRAGEPVADDKMNAVLSHLGWAIARVRRLEEALREVRDLVDDIETCSAKGPDPALACIDAALNEDP